MARPVPGAHSACLPTDTLHHWHVTKVKYRFSLKWWMLMQENMILQRCCPGFRQVITRRWWYPLLLLGWIIWFGHIKAVLFFYVIDTNLKFQDKQLTRPPTDLPTKKGVLRAESMKRSSQKLNIRQRRNGRKVPPRFLTRVKPPVTAEWGQTPSCLTETED